MKDYQILICDVARPTIAIYVHKLLQEMPELFYDNVSLKVVYGVFSGMRWTGGRLIKSSRFCSEEQIRTTVKIFNDLGIGVRLTTTNTLLKDEDLKDEYCNMILRILSEVGCDKQNGLSVASPLLEDYVLSNYPKLYVDKSIVCFTTTIADLKAQIDRGIYNLVVPYTFLPFKQEFLDLDQKYKDHIEILCNSCVSKELNVCKLHYDIVSSEALALSTKHPEYNKCLAEQFQSVNCDFKFNPGERNPKLTPADIQHVYIPHGFKNFKLAGREAAASGALKTIFSYILKDYEQSEETINYLLNQYKEMVGDDDGEEKKSDIRF